MTQLSLALADINKYVNVLATDQPLARKYNIMSRAGSEKLLNKDISGPTNNLGMNSYTKFTVSNDSTFKAKFTSIQAAIDAATLTGNREIVVVKPGTYSENIVLKDRVNLAGESPIFEFSAHNTILTGAVSHQLSADSEVTVSRLTFTDNSSMIFGGINIIRVLFIGVTITGTVAPITVNNPNCILFFNASIISGATVMEVISAGATIFRGSVLGDLFPMLITPVISSQNNTGPLVLIYCNGKIKFDLSNNAFAIISHCFMNGGDEPMAILDNSSMIISNSGYLSGGPGNLIEGTGSVTLGHNTFTPRRAVDPAITLQGVDHIAYINGTYTPTVAVVAGMTGESVVTAKYTRSGGSARVDFKITYTSSAVDPVFTLSLPFGISSFAGPAEAVGSATLFYAGGDQFAAQIEALAASQLVQVSGKNNGAAEAVSAVGHFMFDFT